MVILKSSFNIKFHPISLSSGLTNKEFIFTNWSFMKLPIVILIKGAVGFPSLNVG